MTSRIEVIEARIESRAAKLGVIGLGYVGLPLAALFASAGFRVIGVDRAAQHIALITSGSNPIVGDEPELAELLAGAIESRRLSVTTDYGQLTDVDVALICVNTPVDRDHRPDYAALVAASHGLGQVMPDGCLVIVESTVSPGTTEGVVVPAVARASGRLPGKGFFVGHCPERVMPGRLVRNLRTMPRVCGGQSPAVARTMTKLYRWIVEAELDETDLITAELVKTVENAYRDVNIAFANEVALICEAVGADVRKIRSLVNKSPGRNMLVPGAGVGGHCLPKDPWLLAHAANRAELFVLPAARKVNDGMPLHVGELLRAGLAEHGRGLGQSVVALLGYAYLENTGEARHSPSAALVGHLHSLGVEVRIHDPFISEHRSPIETIVAGADAVVLMVAHRQYREVDLSWLRAQVRTPVLVDGRQVFDPERARAAGFTYLGVGVADRAYQRVSSPPD